MGKNKRIILFINLIENKEKARLESALGPINDDLQMPKPWKMSDPPTGYINWCNQVLKVDSHLRQQVVYLMESLPCHSNCYHYGSL